MVDICTLEISIPEIAVIEEHVTEVDSVN